MSAQPLRNLTQDFEATLNQGVLDYAPAYVRLRIYEGQSIAPVVVCNDLGLARCQGRPWTSVVSRAEDILGQVAVAYLGRRSHKLNPPMIWINHKPVGCSHQPFTKIDMKDWRIRYRGGAASWQPSYYGEATYTPVDHAFMVELIGPKAVRDLLRIEYFNDGWAYSEYAREWLDGHDVQYVIGSADPDHSSMMRINGELVDLQRGLAAVMSHYGIEDSDIGPTMACLYFEAYDHEPALIGY